MAEHEMSERLAKRLKDARKERDLSLDALAKLSGMSRSMISQIERGKNSPTVASLWNLTQALGVDFSGLLDDGLDEKGPILEVVRSDKVPAIHSRGEGCKILILSPPQDVGEIEVYDVEFEAEGALVSEAHKPGCVEHLTVLSGALTVTSAGVSETVDQGDTIRYAADAAHSIVAGEAVSRILLIVKGA